MCRIVPFLLGMKKRTFDPCSRFEPVLPPIGGVARALLADQAGPEEVQERQLKPAEQAPKGMAKWLIHSGLQSFTQIYIA
jgi:hypothetical protein